jgi:hypothetical protein
MGEAYYIQIIAYDRPGDSRLSSLGLTSAVSTDVGETALGLHIPTLVCPGKNYILHLWFDLSVAGRFGMDSIVEDIPAGLLCLRYISTTRLDHISLWLS